MQIAYTIKASIYNKLLQNFENVIKDYSYELVVPDDLLYENDHKIGQGHIFDLLGDSLDTYLNNNNLIKENIDIQSYEILTKTKGAEVFFINPVEPNRFTLFPTIVVYLEKPEPFINLPSFFNAKLIESTSIKWNWEPSDSHGHYIVDLDGNIIATIAVGVDYFIESSLEYNTNYTRRILRYNKEGTSDISNPVTITTGLPKSKDIGYNPYLLGPTDIKRWEEQIYTDIDDKLDAFKSGVGDSTDMLVMKMRNDNIFERFNLLSNLIATRRFTAPVYPPVPASVTFTPNAEVPENHYKGNLDIKLEVSKMHTVSVNVEASAYQSVPVKWKICAKVKYQEINPDIHSALDGLSKVIFK